MAKNTARSRSRVLKPVVLTNTVQTDSHGAYSVLPATVTQSSTQAMDDVVSHGFKRRIAEGEIINNPCSLVRRTRSNSGSGFIRGTKTSGPAYWYQQDGPVSETWLPLYPNGDVMFKDVDYDVASRSKLLALANIDTSEYAFGEDIGELRETLRFLRNPVSSLHNLAREFRRTLTRKRRKDLNLSFAKAHADVWLQYRFAFSPLIRSMMDLAEAYGKGPSDRATRLTARGFDSWKWSGGGAVTRYNGPIGGTNNSNWLFNHDVEVEGHASILYEVSNPLADWRFHLGLRTKDVPYTLWQLLPYSFMVDRLVDISSSIRGLTNLADPDVTILSGSYREKKTERQSYQLTSISNPTWSHAVAGDVVTDEEFIYNRQPWTPSASDAIPGISLGNVFDSATKLADVIALSLQLLRR